MIMEPFKTFFLAILVDLVDRCTEMFRTILSILLGTDFSGLDGNESRHLVCHCLQCNRSKAVMSKDNAGHFRRERTTRRVMDDVQQDQQWSWST